MTVETTPPALMSEDQVVSVLDGLVEVARDGEAGYAWCAEHCASVPLRALCMRRAAETGAAVRELQDLVLAHGGRPDDAGTVSGAVRRGWVTAVSGLPAIDDMALLESCMQAADSALERFREALRKDLPLTVMAVVQRQCEVEERGRQDLDEMAARMRAVAH